MCIRDSSLTMFSSPHVQLHCLESNTGSIRVPLVLNAGCRATSGGGGRIILTTGTRYGYLLGTVTSKSTSLFATEIQTYAEKGSSPLGSMDSLTPAGWARHVASSRSSLSTVSYTHLRAHETVLDLVCRLLLEKKKPTSTTSIFTIILYLQNNI
eukprot:TRINITY_DN3830_c0_g1_i2.p1 TRINITY_DN3830_c0_g1~~TRINITY_DN3830_c0_g1_i2.p1  ORF type:complete len:154 (-),score=38.93 TRINITY_DN3830_c0_g1_i2:6-467(-)